MSERYDGIPEAAARAVEAWVKNSYVRSNDDVMYHALPTVGNAGVQVAHVLAAFVGRLHYGSNDELFTLFAYLDSEQVWHAQRIDSTWIAALSGTQRLVIEGYPMQAYRED